MVLSFAVVDILDKECVLFCLRIGLDRARLHRLARTFPIVNWLRSSSAVFVFHFFRPWPQQRSRPMAEHAVVCVADCGGADRCWDMDGFVVRLFHFLVSVSLSIDQFR